MTAAIISASVSRSATGLARLEGISRTLALRATGKHGDQNASQVRTFADGIATRSTYDFTFPTLQSGLAGFVTVSDTEIGEAVRLLQRFTYQQAEGAGGCLH